MGQSTQRGTKGYYPLVARTAGTLVKLRSLVEALAALAPGGLILGLERREGPQRQRVPVGQRLGQARRLG